MTNYPFASVDDFRDIESINHFGAAMVAGEDPAQVLAAMRRMSRDNARTPVQWDDSPNAGFTTGTPWLPVNPNHVEWNAAAQRDDPASVLAHYRRLIALRHENPVVALGDFAMLLPEHDDVYAFTRGARRTTSCSSSATSSRTPYPLADLLPQAVDADLVLGNLAASDPALLAPVGGASPAAELRPGSVVVVPVVGRASRRCRTRRAVVDRSPHPPWRAPERQECQQRDRRRWRGGAGSGRRRGCYAGGRRRRCAAGARPGPPGRATRARPVRPRGRRQVRGEPGELVQEAGGVGGGHAFVALLQGQQSAGDRVEQRLYDRLPVGIGCPHPGGGSCCGGNGRWPGPPRRGHGFSSMHNTGSEEHPPRSGGNMWNVRRRGRNRRPGARHSPDRRGVVEAVLPARRGRRSGHRRTDAAPPSARSASATSRRHLTRRRESWTSCADWPVKGSRSCPPPARTGAEQLRPDAGTGRRLRRALQLVDQRSAAPVARTGTDLRDGERRHHPFAVRDLHRLLGAGGHDPALPFRGDRHLVGGEEAGAQAGAVRAQGEGGRDPPAVADAPGGHHGYLPGEVDDGREPAPGC